MSFIVEFLLFPGFVFSFFAGSFGWWVDRKLTARFQYRVGPPWYQNFLDIAKLFAKETIIPRDSQKTLFILSPIVSFSSVLLFSFILGQEAFFLKGVTGDIFVILYLLVLPSLCIILGGFSSGNPLSVAGASRETKLMLSYEFIFITVLLISIIKAGGVLSLRDIIMFQQANGSFLLSPSGMIGIVLGIIYIQAKLGVCPFDIPEAEQEIMAGPFVEYSGALLGFFKLSKAILYFTLGLLIISLFWAGAAIWHIAYKYLIFILLLAVIKNTNPRLRINDTVKLFWLILFPLGLIGIILALLGW